MPMLNSIAKVAMKPLPRMVSPKAHSIADYITVGAFFASAGWFWRRSKRAAVASFICGAAELAVSLLTDYPGGTKKVISFRAHRDIDLGLAAMAATMPEFLAFKEEPEKKFFLAQGVFITGLAEVTQFPDRPQRAEKGVRRSKAA
jgi:hypothetical protein